MNQVLKGGTTTDQAPPGRVDGRRLRSARTHQAILAAYIELLRDNHLIPTAEQIAQRARLSERAIFAHFPDMPSIGIAAFDLILGQRQPASAADAAHHDRDTRIRLQVRVRAENCEHWLVLWRMVIAGNVTSREIAQRADMVRSLTRERIKLMYAPELATLDEADRIATVSALEALFDFESWGRLREHYKLSFDQACEAWIKIVGRLLPAPPGNAPASD
jgi:AcrR family transcriptional regulator